MWKGVGINKMTFEAWLESKQIHRRDFNLRPRNLQDKLIEEYNKFNHIKSKK